jgi:hypothetical protein
LNDAGLTVSTPGKGRSVWTAFGYLLADPRLEIFALHDCDIVNYDREMLARLCLPIWCIPAWISSSAKRTTRGSPIACTAASCGCSCRRCCAP